MSDAMFVVEVVARFGSAASDQASAGRIADALMAVGGVATVRVEVPPTPSVFRVDIAAVDPRAAIARATQVITDATAGLALCRVENATAISAAAVDP